MKPTGYMFIIMLQLTSVSTNHECDGFCHNGGKCHSKHGGENIYCECQNGWTGRQCQNTALYPSTTTSVQPSDGTSTTHAPSAFRTCDKLSAISAFVDQKQLVHNMTLCRSGSHASSAAFVMNTCNVTSHTASWKQGSKVMDVCHGSATLPTYTPVGQFVNGRYMDDLHGGNAGIFLGCEDNGTFKLGVQFCDSTPVIHHIGTTSTINPDLYYIII